MGRDKARLRLGKRTLLGQIRETARSAGLSARVIRKDLVPRCGPLGGVYTGLQGTRSDAVLFLSCDMPFVTEALLHAVLERLTPTTRAVFAKQDGQFGFPFVIRREALAVVDGMLARNEFALQQLARELRATSFPVPKRLAAATFNVNTPEEYRVARELVSGTRKNPG
jgi:molybdenum cofactor guanylyltransferase